MNRTFYGTVVLGLLTGCGALRDSPKYQLSDGVYAFRQQESRYIKTFVFVEADTVRILDNKSPFMPVIPLPTQAQFFLKYSFDIDAMTVAFKYRPATSDLPRQLNTDFNGNVFIGYRLDRFKIDIKDTPLGLRKHYYHRGITLGFFGGLGSTAVTPSTTSNLTLQEYNALILTRGIAIMIGVNNLTVGVGAGWDFLTDRDKNLWIYQNKPWYGLTVGLNLN